MLVFVIIHPINVIDPDFSKDALGAMLVVMALVYVTLCRLHYSVLTKMRNDLKPLETT